MTTFLYFQVLQRVHQFVKRLQHAFSKTNRVEAFIEKKHILNV